MMMIVLISLMVVVVAVLIDVVDDRLSMSSMAPNPTMMNDKDMNVLNSVAVILFDYVIMPD